MSKVDSPWNDETKATLTDLWVQGVRTAAIAAQMGMSKGQIIGQAHRLDLPARPSPIKRDAPPAPAKSRVVRQQSLPPLPSFQLTNPVQWEKWPTERDTAPPAIMQIIALPPAEARPASAPVYVSPTRRCAFPLWGDKDRPTHKYCGDPVDRGSYCVEHADLAYVGTRRTPFRHYDY